MEDLHISITGDDSNFSSALQRARDGVRQTTKQIEESGMTVDEFTRHMQKLLESFDKMAAAVNKNTQAQEQAAQAGKRAGEEEKRGADKATEAIEKTTDATKDLGEEFEKSSGIMADGMGKLSKYAAGFLSLQAGKEFIQNVTSIRGEFQKLEVSFNTMLGSEERAQQLMQELTRTAAITPFDLKGVADGAKQLLAYGVAAENVNDTLIHLGDIAAGLSIPLGDLVMLYGTTMTQGRMFTQDLRQFMGRGIPLAEELAKQFGVTKDKVGELVTAGKVGAEEFNKAIMSMSSEGGKFAGLMEAQSHTISGQISNIEDAIDTMFNEIGKSNEGIINDVLGSVSYLVENYKKVGAVLLDAVVAIGLYKTALIAAHAIEKASIAIKQAMAVQEALLTAEAKKLAAARGISIAAAKAELGSVNVLTVAKMRLTAATKALTKAMAANPYTAVAVALSAVAFGIYKIITAEDAATIANRRFTDQMEEMKTQIDEVKSAVSSYLQTLQNSNATDYEKAKAWNDLIRQCPALSNKYDQLTFSTMEAGEAQRILNQAMEDAEFAQLSRRVEQTRIALNNLKNGLAILTEEQKRYLKEAGVDVDNPFNTLSEEAVLLYFKQLKERLEEMKKLRDQVADDNRPIEIRLQEANDNIKIRQEILDFYDRAMVLAKNLQNANSDIEYRDAKVAFDDYIQELEQGVEEARKKMDENPMQVKYKESYESKLQFLNDIQALHDTIHERGLDIITFGLEFENLSRGFGKAKSLFDNLISNLGKGIRYLNGNAVADGSEKLYAAAEVRAKAWNELLQAQKALSDFDRSGKDTIGSDKRKKLVEAVKKAQKAYQDAGGILNKNASKEAATQQQKMFEQELAELERQAQQLEAMKDAQSNAAIAKEQDRTKREIMQAEKDHQDRLNAIDRQAEEMRKANYEAQKKAWEAQNTDKSKSWAGTDIAKDVAANGYKNIQLTKEQLETLKALREKANADYSRYVEERVKDEEKTNREAINGYLRQYGDYSQKRQAIVEEANEKLCTLEEELANATTDEARAAAQARIDTVRNETQQELNELDVQYGKAKAFMSDLFQDISEKSIGEMQRIIDKYEALVKFLNNDNVSRDDLLNLGFTEEEINHALEEFKAKGVSSIKDITDALRNMKGELGDRSPWEKFTQSIGKAVKKIKEASGDNKQDNIGIGIENIGSAVQGVLPEIDTLSTAVSNLFGIDDSGMKKAIETIRGLGTAAEGVGRFLQQDYIGGSIAVLSGLGNIVNSIFGGGDDEAERRRERMIERLNNRIETLSDNVSRLNDTMEKSYGVEAQAAADKAREALANKQQTFLEGLLGDGSLKAISGNPLFGSRFFALRELLENIRDEYGLIGESSTAFGGMTFRELFSSNSAEELAKALDDMRENHFEWWSDLLSYANESEEAWLKGLADTWKEAANITEVERERVLGTSLDTVVSDMLSSLYDLADGAEDVTESVADDWQKMMNRMVVNSLFASKLKNDIEGWMKEWEAAYNNDKNIDKDEEDALRQSYQDIYERYANEIKALREAGILVGATAADEGKKYFESLHDMWASTLTDMTRSAEDWKKELLEHILNDLVESTILDAPFDVMLGETQWHFDNFTSYLENWSGRYRSIMEDANLTDEERNELLKTLIAEQMRIREEQAERSKELAEGIGMDVKEAFSNSLDNLGNTLLDGLLDADKDAEQMGKEIGQTLVKEMLAEMLASEKYATHIEAVRQMWQDILTGKDTDHTIEDVLEKVAELTNDMATDSDLNILIEKYREWGKTVEELKSSFSDIRDIVLNSLTDLGESAADFRKKLEQTMVKDLISRQLDNMEIEVSRGFDQFGQELVGVFQGFNEYAEDWNKRYLSALESGDTALIDQLITEMTTVREDAIRNAEELRTRLEEIAKDTTFTGLEDSFVSSLMNMSSTADEWADEVGRTMAQRIIEKTVVPTMIQPLLKTIQDAFDAAMEAGKTVGTNGNALYDWTVILGDETLKAALADMQRQYPEIKSVIEQIMSLGGVDMSSGFSNSLDSLTDTILGRLLSLDSDVEDIGKQIGQTLIREMLQQMLASGEYADQIAKFKEIWQNILTNSGQWTDENGVAWTLETLLHGIAELEDAIGKDTAFSTLINKAKEFGYSAKDGFSDLRGTFVSMLLDMEGDADTYGKNIGRTMMEQMLNAYIDNRYKEQMKVLNQEWAEALESGNTTALENIKQKVIQLYQAISGDSEVTNIANAIKAFDEVSDKADTTFSEMSGNWTSALMDMEGTAESWAESVGRMIAEKIINSMVMPTMIQPLLDEMQKAWNTAAEQEGATYQTMLGAMTPYLSDLVGAYENLRPIADYILNSLGVYKEVVEELEDEVEYALQDMKSNFASSLMDMEATAEDRAQSISRILAEAFINDFVLGDAFDAQMEQWQKYYESILHSDLSEDERASQLKLLRDAIASAKEGYVEQAVAIQELLGLNATNSNQTATANIADKITYEQADQLLGINMAQEMTLEQILATIRGGVSVGGGIALAANTNANGDNEEAARQIETMLLSLTSLNLPDGDTVREIRGLIVIGNGYLYDIKMSNEQMLRQFGERLESIDNKIGQIF